MTKQLQRQTTYTNYQTPRRVRCSDVFNFG